MIYCASPLKVHAATVSELSYFSYDDWLDSHYDQYFIDDYFYFIFKCYQSENPDIFCYTLGFLIPKDSYNFTSSDSLLSCSVTDFMSFEFFSKKFTRIDLNSFSHYDFSDVNSANSSSNYICSGFSYDLTSGYLNVIGSSYSDAFADLVVYDFVTNIPDYSSSDLYDVRVDFNPSLIGDVDRSIVSQDGSKSMRSNLVMTVDNNCTFDIQYQMRIVKKNQVNLRASREGNQASFASDSRLAAASISYDDDPVFIYYSNDWVYTTDFDSETTMFSDQYVKDNKSTMWHFLQHGASDSVTFDFSQINMTENEEYICTVTAVRNDYGIASTQIVYLASSDPAYPELKQIQGDDIQTVYSSEFRMINYSDVVYDPYNDSNGVNPYNGKNGIVDREKYSYSRNAREDKQGNIDYKAVDLLNDKNSWINKQFDVAHSNHNNYYSNNSSVPNSLKQHFNGFFGLVSSVFGHLPGDIQSIYVYGFVSVFVLACILKVIR